MTETLLTTQNYCQAAIGHPWHQPYHDHEYGFPLLEDASLFERLILEINQAGLSWLTILKKRTYFHQAYWSFDIDRVAAATQSDRANLLTNVNIIRNRLKVNAAIENAKRLQKIRQAYGSFYNWLHQHHPRRKNAWIKLFRQTFTFTGVEITGEFLMSIGMLPGAHQPHCPVFQSLTTHCPAPAWLAVVASQPDFYATL